MLGEYLPYREKCREISDVSRKMLGKYLICREKCRGNIWPIEENVGKVSVNSQLIFSHNLGILYLVFFFLTWEL